MGAAFELAFYAALVFQALLLLTLFCVFFELRKRGRDERDQHVCGDREHCGSQECARCFVECQAGDADAFSDCPCRNVNHGDNSRYVIVTDSHVAEKRGNKQHGNYLRERGNSGQRHATDSMAVVPSE